MGTFIALVIMGIWGGHLWFSLMYSPIGFSSISMYLHILFQIWISTGLFITAHDAMHGGVAPYRLVNNIIGFTASLLYAGMWYPMLLRNHKLHHKHPGTEKDPDYSPNSQNFWYWWFLFMKKYLTIYQIVFMAAAFNVLKIWFTDMQLLLFWVLPSVLSTFQLFYFGTYRPHRQPHTEQMLPYNARSQAPNHFWAFISCYFFGYHYEHHEFPRTPWWKLYRTRSHA